MKRRATASTEQGSYSSIDPLVSAMIHSGASNSDRKWYYDKKHMKPIVLFCRVVYIILHDITSVALPNASRDKDNKKDICLFKNKNFPF